MTPDEYDEHANNLMAAGAVLALLASSRNATLESLEPVVDAAGNVTNQIDIGLVFLSSPYRITVERVQEPDA